MQQLVTLVFTEREVKEGMLCLLDGRRNSLAFDDPEHKRLSTLIERIQNDAFSMIEVEGDKFSLIVNGICFEDEVDVL